MHSAKFSLAAISILSICLMDHEVSFAQEDDPFCWLREMTECQKKLGAWTKASKAACESEVYAKCATVKASNGKSVSFPVESSKPTITQDSISGSSNPSGKTTHSSSPKSVTFPAETNYTGGSENGFSKGTADRKTYLEFGGIPSDGSAKPRTPASQKTPIAATPTQSNSGGGGGSSTPKPKNTSSPISSSKATIAWSQDRRLRITSRSTGLSTPKALNSQMHTSL